MKDGKQDKEKRVDVIYRTSPFVQLRNEFSF